MIQHLIRLTAIAFFTAAASAEEKPTLYLIGDSTVNNSTKGLQGWGKPIAALFDETKIRVDNQAIGGRSSRSYLREGRWDKVAAMLKPGDFVLMQFGHNDNGPLDSEKARASIKGNGDEAQEVTIKETGVKETVHSYGWYLRKYATDTKAKGATAIVLSLIPRNIWVEGKVLRATDDYTVWATTAAHDSGAFFVDLNAIVATHYEALGEEKVKTDFFTADHTHTTPEGAALNAASVIEGVQTLKDCPLASFLRK